MKNLKAPNRALPTLDYAYAETEEIVQEDGKIARFINRSDSKEGWRFVGFVDRFGFFIIDEEKDNSETIKLLAQSEIPLGNYREELGPLFKINPNENLHAFKYGGCMSMRRGYFITDDSDKIIKYIIVAMS